MKSVVSSTDKTYLHDITEILSKMELSTYIPTYLRTKLIYKIISMAMLVPLKSQTWASKWLSLNGELYHGNNQLLFDEKIILLVLC
jgi:hypothetical protein